MHYIVASLGDPTKFDWRESPASRCLTDLRLLGRLRLDPGHYCSGAQGVIAVHFGWVWRLGLLVAENSLIVSLLNASYVPDFGPLICT